ncbi:AIPR family protein [Pseudomonas sp. B8(2017)]|uniref:AIPR family protein n=1 Tax=Pseudomonas sp. B8(2017) TaxID=1981711 RepID=UPI000A1DAAFE|nr:AIPR family protein [Pseudomonas sp. B8(2017)]
MELAEFLQDTQTAIRDELSKDFVPGKIPVSAEELFTEQVMNHLSDQGITFDTNVCHYEAKVGRHKVKLSGYSVSDTTDEAGNPDRLDLFVSLYKGSDQVELLADQEVARAASQGIQFLRFCANNQLSKQLDETNNVYALVAEVERIFANLDSIRVFIITDARVKTRDYAPHEVENKQVRIEVMDIQRLFNHLQQGHSRDELVVNFPDLCGGPLPSVWVPGSANDEYDYALTAVPGNALRALYEKYGPRILEANVRSFLGVGAKGVNKGIRDTLRDTPDRFMAYNNGIVIVATASELGRTSDGSVGISSLKGMQIVNGGQTTASIYFAKRKQPALDLDHVRVPAKIIVLRSENSDSDELIAKISRFANSQNVVKQSDLSANKPFHRELEKMSMRTFCPDGIGRWFYERSAGSYKVMLEKDAATPAQKKKLQSEIPATRKLTKPDLAKYIFAWGQKPNIVSLGSQKNFQAFMDDLSEREEAGEDTLPTPENYKEMIAKAIIFKAAQRIIRPVFPAFQANITAYTVSLLGLKLGTRFRFDLVWQEQRISPALEDQIVIWAKEVDRALHKGAGGRMISEWAKKAECWEEIKSLKYTSPDDNIPEIH